MKRTQEYLDEVAQYGARNYHPLDVVLAKGRGAWVWDVDGHKYLDCLSAYSAVSQGHCHPTIVRAARKQLGRLTLTSRAFHNDQMGSFLRELCELAGYDRALPMNSGAEAVETAIKTVRKWGYEVKGVPDGKAEIITFAGNFHGRTTTIVSFSTEPQYKEHFGPLTPGFVTLPYGDAAALERAITPHTVAVLIEPIQGEAGVIIPPEGYLRRVRDLCAKHRVLFVADEIQTGLGRTGKLFACQWEDVRPDVLILGKALSGGLYPVSAVLADEEVMGVLKPGDHGSTFGGNPLAAAIGRAALRVVVEEDLAERSRQLGHWFMGRLRQIDAPHVREVRGRGLFIAVELDVSARPYCEALAERGILAKETYERVVRFAPPLVIAKADLEWALPRIADVLAMDFEPAVAAAT